MSDISPILLTLDQPYPFKLASEGVIAEFLRPSGNILIVAIPGISAEEEKALRKGEMRCGMLFKNGAILFLWQFLLKGKPVLSMDSQFNSKIIHDIQLHNIETAETRLLIEVHIIDTESGLIKGLRGITMPPALTLKFFSAVQDQLAGAENGESQHAIWAQLEPEQLTKSTRMFLMGE